MNHLKKKILSYLLGEVCTVARWAAPLTRGSESNLRTRRSPYSLIKWSQKKFSKWEKYTTFEGKILGTVNIFQCFECKLQGAAYWEVRHMANTFKMAE